MAEGEASVHNTKNRKRKKNDQRITDIVKHVYNPLPYSKAKELLKDRFSCLCEVEIEKKISLPPRFIGSINEGIRQTLQSWLLTYDEEKKGYLVAYDRVKLRQRTGTIINESPCINFDITATFILFRPMVGDKLKGTVTRIGNHHYACLVHDCFNASVRKVDLKKRLTSSLKSKPEENISIGNTLYFQVTAVEMEDSAICIKGILNNFTSNLNGIRI